MHQCSLFILVLLCVSVKDISGSWEEWWTYDGISGPGFWGLINPQWSMCNKGRRQSPVNIEPDKLLFDPWLRDIQFDKHKVSGVLQNTGQSLVFRVEKDSKHQVNISGGPLSYRYQFEEIYFHYGMEDNRGSEHQIDHHTFPGEIQLYGFNKELYHNMSEAQHKSQGIVGISLMVQVGEPINTDFRLITSAFNKVTYRGASFPIKHLPLSSLLPNTQQYLTYEGSTTHPGCWETAVWIIFNKPIYISKQEVGDTTRIVAAAAEADAWTTMMVSAEPSRSNEIANDHVIMQILTDPIVPQSVTNGDTTDDVQGNAYNGFYSSTVNFNDIYSNNLVVLGEDPAPPPAPAPVPEPAPPSTEKEEDSFQLKNLPAEYVEFRPQTQAVSPATLPPAIYILNSTYILNINTTESSSTSTTITTEVTEEPAEISVKVIPIKKDYQRGILDLLFPAARVKTFKTVFDTFRHLMSHTFR